MNKSKNNKTKSVPTDSPTIKNYPEGIQTAVQKLLFDNEIRKPFKQQQRKLENRKES